MTAGQHVGLYAEAFAGEPLLEGQGKEPVTLSGQNAGRDTGPGREVAGRLEHRLCFGALVRFASERGTRWATVLHVGSAVGSVVAGVALAWNVVTT